MGVAHVGDKGSTASNAWLGRCSAVGGEPVPSVVDPTRRRPVTGSDARGAGFGGSCRAPKRPAAAPAREAETGAHIPIIALTAHALREDELRCHSAGMDDYVSKPIDPGRLAAAIRAQAGRTVDP